MRRRTLVMALAVAVPAAAAIACSSILGFKDLTLLDAGAAEAGPDANVDAADAAEAGDAPEEAEAGPACMRAVPPGFPATDDSPDGGTPDIVFALSSIDLGQDATPQHNLLADAAIGFDLDNVCTCFEDAGPSCSAMNLVCDRSNGRDLGANVLLSSLALADGHLSQQSLQSDIQAGQFTVLVVVRAYNGLANDQTVFVSFLSSPGTVRDNGGNPIPPNFDGNDTWLVEPSSVLLATDGGYISRYQDNQAYVNDHVLVTHLPLGFPLFIRPNTGGNDNPVTFSLTALEMSATIGRNGSGVWTLTNGNVGARWPANSALYDFRTLSDMQGNSICGDSGYFAVLSTAVCTGVDIPSNPSKDNTGASCDALSVGMGFNATAALFGGELDVEPVNVNCPNPWAPMCP